MEIIDNCQTNESTETLSYKSYSSICNELYSVTKNNNVIYIFIVGMLLEIKEIIMSKQNKNLDLNQMITQFTTLKNIFTSLEKVTRLMLIEPSSSFFTRKYEKQKSNRELSKI